MTKCIFLKLLGNRRKEEWKIESRGGATDRLEDIEQASNILEAKQDVKERLENCKDVTDRLNDSQDVTNRNCKDVTDRLNVTNRNCEDVTDRLEDYEDVSSSIDDCDVIKIEMEENTFPVELIIKEDTKKEKGLVDVESGKIYFDHDQIQIYLI